MTDVNTTQQYKFSRIINNMAPAYMNELMTISNNKSYNLRSNLRNDIALSNRPRTNYLKDTFSYFSMNIWNSIPLDIRKSKQLKNFKVNYKAHLLQLSRK